MLLPILISVIIVSLISFVGVLFLALKDKVLSKILLWLVALAIGALLGGAFLHLLPESAAQLKIEHVGILFLVGLMLFFVLEKFIHWRHCHEKNCKVHAFSHLILVGDGLHNFIDGLVIAAAYLVNLSLGITTTLAIILHEIPQEIGDFGVLIHGGFKKKKALFYNFLSALTAVVGAIVGYFLGTGINMSFLLPIAAGGFVYIAATDLIPELHKKSKPHESITQFIFIIIGIALMWLLKFIL
jgi:zinc and cadmium transporter